jgi:putative oxidoreductase
VGTVTAGLLLLRLVVGGTFVVHGVDKLVDLSSAERYFASLGVPAPALIAPFVGAVEAGGGMLLIAGLATPLVGPALAGDMFVAFLTEHVGDGFFVAQGGFEFVMVLAGASLALALTGPGRFSVDEALDVPLRLRSRHQRLASRLASWRIRPRGTGGKLVAVISQPPSPDRRS